LAPAPIPVGCVVVTERYAKEREVIESINEGKAMIAIEAAKPMPEAVIAIEATKPATETVIPIEAASAIEAARYHAPADKAVSTGDEHAPAGEHAATETAATEPAVESSATEPTVEAAAEPAAAERQGWCRYYDCRSHRGRGKAPEQFGPHDADPPYALREFSSAPANCKQAPTARRSHPRMALGGN
jgi:hypothetical protein